MSISWQFPAILILIFWFEVVSGHIDEYRIKDVQKLEEVAKSIGIEVEGRSLKEIALDLYKELERTYTQVEGEIPFAARVPEKTLELWMKAMKKLRNC